MCYEMKIHTEYKAHAMAACLKDILYLHFSQANERENIAMSHQQLRPLSQEPLPPIQQQQQHHGGGGVASQPQKSSKFSGLVLILVP